MRNSGLFVRLREETEYIYIYIYKLMTVPKYRISHAILVLMRRVNNEKLLDIFINFSSSQVLL